MIYFDEDSKQWIDDGEDVIDIDENDILLESLLLDKAAHTLQRVGRRNMSAQELWHDWLINA
jgi:hypothetical protein